MTTTTAPREPNRLIHETSPYLLQHAYNPVDWYPWGPEALTLAKTQNRPILLSIGYSACHWCHVMERESFENEAIAALMNRHFICVKVDREERPDLDEIYMQATVTLNRGQGGWPMTVFLTPEQQPFFAGTYFPPDDRWGRPGFPSLLKKIAEVWEQDSQGLRAQAGDLTERLRAEWKTHLATSVERSALDDAAKEYAEAFDARYGGFGTAPKFPPATGLSLLLRCYRRSKDAAILEMVTKTLDAMAAGGIYDHIGGGFARYSTDDRWLVPHFEKMLYDNALLAKTYLEAYQLTKRPRYREVVCEILDYVLRDMTAPDGGFYSATDADSEGVEGKFFVWTPAQVSAALGNEEEARRLCVSYDITEQGNWEHHSIPNRLRPIEAVANDLGLTVEELTASMRHALPRLYRARSLRVPPALDDKVITAWNGMMISAMSEAGRVLGQPRYLEGARRAADFLLRCHNTESGGLLRTSRKEKAQHRAVLEDYAYLGEGLIDLYEATGEDRYLASARALADRMLSSFHDRERGGFYTTADDHEMLIARAREGADGAIPSGNAVAAMLLARLSFHDNRQDYRQAAADAIRAYGKQIARMPRAFAKSLAVVDLLTEGPVELALVGTSVQPESDRLEQVLRDSYLPNRIVARTRHTDGSATHPLLAGKSAVEGRPTLYVCRNFACQRPTTVPQEALELLNTVNVQRVETNTALVGHRLAGHASPQGTGRYAAGAITHQPMPGRLEHGFRSLGMTGLTVSKLGFGCYRIDGSDPEHAASLEQALLGGVNLIDTSTNYMDGESERLVGAVLHRLAGHSLVRREEIVVVSKMGYAQGQNLKQAERREQQGRPYPEMVKYGEGIWHCIHPEFLEDQLTASLDRLALEQLDICLLHNPEYFLAEAAQRGDQDVAGVRDEFYRRIEQAFGFLESQVAAGRIGWYGVSSNNIGFDMDNPEATSLRRFHDAAVRAAMVEGAKRTHFAVLQCPMNLFETGPLFARNTGPDGGYTALEVARQQSIAVLVNRPLNAMPPNKSGMMRLAALPIEGESVDIEGTLKGVEALEQEYRTALAPSLPFSEQGTPPSEFFNWAAELARIRPLIQGLEQWEHIEHQMIAPHVNQVLQAIPRLLGEAQTDRWEAWRDRYIPQLLMLLRGLRREATERSLRKVGVVAAALDNSLPLNRRNEPLARKALWVLTSTPGVSCVLNGMRSKRYVEDALEVLGWNDLDDVEQAYRAVSERAQNSIA